MGEKFTCNECGDSFTRKDNLERHYDICEGTPDMPHKCRVCDEGFSRKAHMRRHEVKCQKMKRKLKNTQPDKKKHDQQPEKKKQKKQKWPCDHCDYEFQNPRLLASHIYSRHLQSDRMESVEDEAMRDEMRSNKGYILAPHKSGNYFNFPLVPGEDLDRSVIQSHMEHIYQNTNGVFKVNAAISRMLYNTETDKYSNGRGYVS